MNKLIPIIAVVVLIIAGVGGFFALQKKDPNKDKPALVETPPSVSKVNTLALGLRPYVALVPHENRDTAIGCSGVDLLINSLKNGESNVEYELEYTTAKQIQGVFGRRDFTETTTTHKPLEFGTCSKGRCVCDRGITGGNLKLTFSGKENYVLKGDFAMQNVGENQGKLYSKDARLQIDVKDALPKTTDVLISSTMGLPQELTDKVILGPYGIFAQGVDTLKKPITVTIQSQEAANSKIRFYDGKDWQVIQAKVEGDKASFELNKLGVIVLTE